MADFTKEDFDKVKEEDYVEDEFGLALKGYLILRMAFYLVGTFAIIGAVFALVTGSTTINDLVSSATGLNIQSPVLNEHFNGLQICMFMQAFYTLASLACVGLFYIKRTRLFAFIDIGLFVLFAAVFFIMGSFDILFNGSAWLLYFLLNPVISFVALFVGKHFDYMPLK